MHAHGLTSMPGGSGAGKTQAARHRALGMTSTLREGSYMQVHGGVYIAWV